MFLQPTRGGSPFVPHHMRAPPRRPTHSACQFCGRWGHRRDLFKIKDGPVTWFFCNELHAELWLEYRYRRETWGLMRMLPTEKAEYLNGRTMEDEILRLFPEECDPKPP